MTATHYKKSWDRGMFTIVTSRFILILLFNHLVIEESASSNFTQSLLIWDSCSTVRGRRCL